MIKLAATILLLIISTSSFAEHRNLLNHCVPNKAYLNDYEPEIFSTTNNLLRKTGHKSFFCGQKIYLKLEIVDKKCVPISDAKIYLWQAGCDGKYPYTPLRNKVKKELINLKAGSSFVGSGIATSNNLGLANFVTIYPTSVEKENPYINIRIEHKDFGIFQTKLYVKKDDIIEADYYDIVEMRITTPWENAHRRY